MLELIEKMVREGYVFSTGWHRGGLLGYWASFDHSSYGDKRECPECGGLEDAGWDNAGHGHTVAEAAFMARDIACGRKVNVPDSRNFKRMVYPKP